MLTAMLRETGSDHFCTAQGLGRGSPGRSAGEQPQAINSREEEVVVQGATILWLSVVADKVNP